jgi:DNA-binding CsgD family transcriptional regulator
MARPSSLGNSSTCAKKLKISEKAVDWHLNNIFNNNIFNKLDLSSRAAATAYAYQHRLL